MASNPLDQPTSASSRRVPRRPAALVTTILLLATGAACSGAGDGDGAAADATDTTAVDPTPTIPPGQDSPLDEVGGHDASIVVRYTIEGDGSGDDPNRDAVADLEERLMDGLEPAGVGELDESVVEGATLTVTIYGPDLDALWARARPILERYPARPAFAELRDGGPEQPATRIDL